MGDRSSEPLLIVRHGRADDSHPLGDFARPLDARGRVIFRAHALVLCESVKLRGIVASPLVRAVQTAELLAGAAGLDEVQIAAELQPTADPVDDAERILDLARELGPGHALVGHNPSLGIAAGRAVGRTAMRLRKGAAVALELQGRGFHFRFRLAPAAAPETDLDDID